MPILTRFLSFLLRPLTTLLSLYVLGASSYHISQSRPHISRSLYAVTVISGAASLWGLLSSITSICAKRGTTLCTMLLLDAVFSGGFIAVSILLRHAARTDCGTQDQPTVCKVDKAAFSVSVANAVFFLLLALLTHRILAAYKRTRAFGPGPENGYSTTPSASAPRRKRWTRGTDETEGDTGAFTRTGGHNHGFNGGYREPNGALDRGSFDPELGAQPVRGEQVF